MRTMCNSVPIVEHLSLDATADKMPPTTNV